MPNALAQAISSVEGVATAAKPVDKEVQKLSEFVVTAEKPYTDRNVDIPRGIDDVQAYQVIDKDDIERANAVDMNTFLKEGLPQNTANSETGTVQPQAGSVDGTRPSDINLRGMGSSSTLVLINGRRAAPTQRGSTTGQADLNTIPMGAVEKIVVLAGSGSAIYGGSAAGGVINVILKKNYQGGEIDMSYGDVFKGHSPATGVDFSYGLSLGAKTHVLMTFSFKDRPPLHVSDRPYIRDYDRQTMRNVPNGGPGSRWTPTSPYPGTTPNIELNPGVVNGYANPSSTALVLKNGTSLNSTMTYIPLGANASTDLAPALLANAGQINFNVPNTIYRGGLAAPLGAHPLTRAYRAAIDHELTRHIEAFLETSYALSGADNYSDPFTGTYSVPGNSPANPFRQNVFINFPRDVVVPNWSSSESVDVSSGIVANFGNDWRGVASYTWSLSAFSQRGPIADPVALARDLNNGALNPFVDTLAFPLKLTPYMALYDYLGHTTMNTVDLHASGPVTFMKFIKPVITIGMERRKESSDDHSAKTRFPLDPVRDNDIRYFGQSRSIDSLFAEATTPLVKQEDSRPLLRAFDLQVAARAERLNSGITSSGGGGSIGDTGKFVTGDATSQTLFPNNPSANTATGLGYHQNRRSAQTTAMVGFKYQPFHDVTIRGSYAQALVAPTMAQLTGGSTGTAVLISDPKSGGATYNVDRLTGGNPDLRATDSVTRSIGLIWEPTQELLKGFRFNFEKFEIRQQNVITTPSAQELIDMEGQPAANGRIFRDPTTKLITVVDLSAVNFARLVSSGYDVSGDYRRKTPIGTFQLRASATVTQVFEKSTGAGPLKSYLNYINRSGAPSKYKANASLNWRKQNWSAGWNTNYFGGYRVLGSPGDPVGANTNYAAAGDSKVGSQIIHAINVAYAFGRTAERSRFLSDLTVIVGINNVFDARPARDTFYSTFISSTYITKAGREWWLKAKKTF